MNWYCVELQFTRVSYISQGLFPPNWAIPGLFSSRTQLMNESCFLRNYKKTDVMDSAQALVMALRKFNMDPVEGVNRLYADKIMDYRLESHSNLNEEIVKAIESLWHDPIIPSVLDRSSEFYLMDSAS